MWTIPTIVDACGGRSAIAERLDCSRDAVRKWEAIGIPDRHWTELMEMAGDRFGPIELHAANLAARSGIDTPADAAE